VRGGEVSVEGDVRVSPKTGTFDLLVVVVGDVERVELNV
jgi:hypothetical protein